MKPVDNVLTLYVRHARGVRKLINVHEWKVTNQGNLVIKMTAAQDWRFVYAKGAWSELESVYE